MTDRRVPEEGSVRDGGDEPLEVQDPGDEPLEVQDPGDTLQQVLEEEERSAVAATETKLRSVQKDLEDLRDRHLRKLAEFENMRKRSEREKQEYFRHSLLQFARDFLPVLDHLELAMQHATPTERKSQFGQGVGMIRRQLMDVWKNYGLSEVDTSGPFDPNVHEAVATENAEDVPPQTILDVLQKGYQLEDKLVRPARVKVSMSGRGTPESGVATGPRGGSETED